MYLKPTLLQRAGQQKYRIVLMTVIFTVFVLKALGLFSVSSSGGLAFHPGLIEQVLTRGQRPPLITHPGFIGFVVTGLPLCLLLPLMSPIKGSLLTLLSMFPPLLMAMRPPLAAEAMPLEFSLLCILVLFSCNALMGFFQETQERHKLLTLFGQYVPRELVKTLSERPEMASMSGASREMTVLFCDIRGFTRIAESLEPSQLAAMLNAYFTAMTRILYRHGATIDKYMGDAIMAFWSAPLPQPDHAQRAVRAALEMQHEIRLMKDHFIDKGWPQLSLGIGISSGEMAVGNMGSKYRIAYTVVGDAVNLGARLEHLTRTYGVGIIVSEQTRRDAAQISFRELDLVMVRGKAHTTRIYEPLGASNELTELTRTRLEHHRQALQHYYQRHWKEAKQGFLKLQGAGCWPHYCQLMLNRIRDFEERPPTKNWQGATRYEQTASFSELDLQE